MEYFRALHENNLGEESKYPPTTLADYIERRASDGGLTDWTVCLKSTGKSKVQGLLGVNQSVQERGKIIAVKIDL